MMKPQEGNRGAITPFFRPEMKVKIRMKITKIEPTGMSLMVSALGQIREQSHITWHTF